MQFRRERKSVLMAIIGDKSAVDVVAHEIAHSWMGNLVTTSNWEHFWLNEGWTVFIERKIAGKYTFISVPGQIY